MNKISVKVALYATCAAALPVALVLWLSPGPSAWLLSVPLVVGIATYLASHRLISRRIADAIRGLDHISQHDFENVRDEFDEVAAASKRSPDEIDALILRLCQVGTGIQADIDQLKRIETYRKDFLGNVSHELKTPIFSVKGFAETLLNGALDDSRVRRSFVEKILRNSIRLSHLADDLSEISRIENGRLKMDPAPFDMARLISEVVESLDSLAVEKGVRLRGDATEGGLLPMAMGDEQRIRQVLVNLVDNAIKYTDKDGSVELVARATQQGAIKVTVADNGIGIKPESIGRVTERFFRVDTSRSRSQGGTGLGLAIVKHLLNAHDSPLLIESKPGVGSTFGFSLAAVDYGEARRMVKEQQAATIP